VLCRSQGRACFIPGGPRCRRWTTPVASSH